MVGHPLGSPARHGPGAAFPAAAPGPTLGVDSQRERVYRGRRDDAEVEVPALAATEHGPASQVIGDLRECAFAIATLGDEIERLQRDLDGALAENERMRADEMDAQHVLDNWTALLEDFRLGVRDANELLERTVGRR